MSRGRETNQLYVQTTSDMEPDAHLRPAPVDPVAATVTRLSRSRAEQPLSTTPGIRTVRALSIMTSPEARVARQLHTDLEEAHREHAWLVHRLAEQRDELDRRRRPAVTPSARSARRRVEAEATESSRRMVAVEQRIARLEQQLIGLPARDVLDAAAAEYKAARTELADLVARRLETVMHAPPRYLVPVVGPPPSGHDARVTWRRAIEAIERYRARWGVTDRQEALGAEPTLGAQRNDRERVLSALDEVRSARTLEQGQSRGLGLTR